MASNRICCPSPTQANGGGWLGFITTTPCGVYVLDVLLEVHARVSRFR